MRKISGIKYSLAGHVPLGGCFAITLIVLLSCQLAYSGTEITGRLNVNTSQTGDKLIKCDRAGESRMIKKEKLYDFFAIQVTTTNQNKFDRDRDGYLSGRELQEYLRKYHR